MIKPKEHVEIPDPLYARIILTDVQHVLHSPPVQRMAQIKQLGGGYFVYPSATHTRLSHMMGAAHITQIRTRWLKDEKKISDRDARNCVVTALCHDVGHWPFSHLLEPLCGNHDERGLEIILGELAPYIERCDVDPNHVAELMQRRNTLSELIFSTPIGADKLDYLRRDSYFSLGDGQQIDDLITTSVRWDQEQGLYVLPKGVPLTQKTIELYWNLYMEVYTRSSVRVAERYIQEILRQMIVIDEVVKNRLFSGGEDGVIGAIGYWAAMNHGHECAERYDRFQQRRYPKKALIFSANPELAPLRNKPTLAKIECDQHLVERTESFTPEQVATLERQIAELIGATHPQVVLAVSPPIRRWKVPDVKVETATDVICQIGDLFPGLHAMSADKAKMACSVVVALDVDLRSKVVADPGLQRDIAELLERA